MRIIIGVVLLALAGCAQMVPARYSELSVGKYQLEASGNVFASIESLIAKIDKRAVQICGEGGFEYLDGGDFSTPHSPAYVNGVDIGGSYKVVRRKISCKEMSKENKSTE